MAVPYTFATATSSIPLSQLDSNFATGITLGNTTVYLGNTTTSIGNLTLTNATISSVATTFPNSFLANSSVTIGSTNISLGGTSTTLAGLTGVTSSAITDSGLTSGRVTYATTGGLLTDSANLTFDGTNLGIGTSSPAVKLDVQNNGDVTARSYSTNASNQSFVQAVNSSGIYIGLLQYGASKAVYGALGAGGGAVYSVANVTVMADNPTGFINFATGGNTERMRIDSSGNVGIGTSSPSTLLNVHYGALESTAFYELMLNANYANSNSLGGKIGITFSGNPSGTTGGATKTAGVYGISTDNTIYSRSMGLVFYTSAIDQSSVERMRIDSSGTLLIGTTSSNASALLDVQSTTKGVRFPNMTTTQKNAISSPFAGTVIFDTTLAKLCVYSGSAWQTITSI